MNNNAIGITSATIRGLKKDPYYLNYRCYWAWDIRFEEQPFFTFTSLCWLYMGETEAEAKETCRKLRNIFNRVRIFDGDKVGVIYDNNGVIAIGKNRTDCWVHVRDKYKVKSFKELNIDIKSLVVACRA